MGKLGLIIEALYKGKCLANPGYWKNVQNVINALFSILAAVRVFLPEELREQFSDEGLQSIVDAIAVIGIGVVNAYFTTATTDKIGPNSKSGKSK